MISKSTALLAALVCAATVSAQEAPPGPCAPCVPCEDDDDTGAAPEAHAEAPQGVVDAYADALNALERIDSRKMEPAATE